jgi:hypothetical protein
MWSIYKIVIIICALSLSPVRYPLSIFFFFLFNISFCLF